MDVGVAHHLRELEMQVVLDVAVEGYFAAPFPAIGLHLRTFEVCVVAPAGEVGGAVFIAQRAEGRIGQQPFAVDLEKVPVVAAVRRACPVAGEGFA